jgi:hypothetical protein
MILKIDIENYQDQTIFLENAIQKYENFPHTLKQKKLGLLLWPTCRCLNPESPPVGAWPGDFGAWRSIFSNTS